MEYQLDDKKGFSNALSKETGIDPNWIEFGTVEDSKMKQDPAASHGDRRGQGWVITSPRKVDHIFNNAPKLKSDFEVPNPKEILRKASSGAEDLQASLQATKFEMILGLYTDTDSIQDPVEVFSVPAFFLDQAIDGIANVKDIGERVEQQERKDLILTVLTAVFTVVPFVGEVGAIASGLTQLARVIAAVGFAADSALSIVDIVENPEMAPMAIMGMLLGAAGAGAGGGKAASMSDMARARKEIRGDTLKAMGGKFRQHDATLQKVVDACRR